MARGTTIEHDTVTKQTRRITPQVVKKTKNDGRNEQKTNRRRDCFEHNRQDWWDNSPPQLLVYVNHPVCKGAHAFFHGTWLPLSLLFSLLLQIFMGQLTLEFTHNTPKVSFPTVCSHNLAKHYVDSTDIPCACEVFQYRAWNFYFFPYTQVRSLRPAVKLMTRFRHSLRNGQ